MRIWEAILRSVQQLSQVFIYEASCILMYGFANLLLQAISRALTEDELNYLSAQFKLLEPKDGLISLENFRTVSATCIWSDLLHMLSMWEKYSLWNMLSVQALMKNASEAMRESRVLEILNLVRLIHHFFFFCFFFLFLCFNIRKNNNKKNSDNV